MWANPSFNTQLYLNYKGFDEIAGLEEYTRVRSLHLGNNNIGAIQGLDRMSDLVYLSLEGNRLSSIDNLDNLLSLRTLSLQHNALKSTHGIGHLPRLETLNVSHNAIDDLQQVKDLQTMPSLINVDISYNELEAEDVVEFWAELRDHLRALSYQGNPGVRNVRHYRKRLINALPSLTYLDDRPVFPVERRACGAWAEGGIEAMQKAKQDFHRARHNELRLDKERSEKLGLMRDRALARIEREAKKREEAEAAMAARESTETAGASQAARDGNLDALKDYEKSWATKVSLYGTDGVRDKVAQEASATATGRNHPTTAAPEEPVPNPAARPGPSREAFNPPPRTAAPQPQSAPAASAENATLSSAGGPRRQPVGRAEASDFRVRSDAAGRRANPAGGGAMDRQLAVLGDDPWSGNASALQRPAEGGPSAMRPTRGGGCPTADSDVVPDVWKRLMPAAAEAEARAMEMNTRAAEAWYAGERDANTFRNELNSLD